MKPKISIIVPVFNSEKTIGDCLDSLTSQTIDNIDIICVNDGSSDRSLQILDEYKKKDSHIQVVSQENKGRSAARNAGLELVKTDYVMFCDSDDSFDSTMCEKMLNAIEKNDVDIVACGIGIKYEAHSEVRESDENYYKIKFSGRNLINERIIKDTDTSICNKILKMDLINQYKLRFPNKLNNEDYYFYNAYMSVAKTIFYIDQKLYKYIRHEGSIMSESFDKTTNSSDHLRIAIKLFDFYKENGFLVKHKDLFWHQFLESFWFSYDHSAKKYRKVIQQRAKKFIEKNFDSYAPLDPKLRRKIYDIKNNGFIYKVVRKVKNIFRRIYLKISIAYRQQNKINRDIDRLSQDTYELLDAVNKIEERMKND